MTKVIDCFPFFDEFLILDIRFRELYDIVDKFVIVEANETFTGLPKPLYLSEKLQQRYPQYADKVDIIVAPAKYYENAWDREFFQKNHLCKENLSHLNLSEDDLILISDVDEIPRKEAIVDMKQNGYKLEGGLFEGPMFYYKLNVQLSQRWDKVKFISYGSFTNHTQQRYRPESNMILNSTWHFSYLKTPEEIQEKINAFSHQELNNETYNTIDNITSKIKTLSDLFDRPEVSLSVVPVDDSFPEYVKEHIDDLKEWIA